MATDTPTTHVLVPAVAAEALKLLGKALLRYQSDLLREAVDDMLARYGAPDAPTLAASTLGELPLRSVVFRLSPEKLEALAALKKRTHIPQAEWLRRAILDVLEKYAGPLSAAVTARRAPEASGLDVEGMRAKAVNALMALPEEYREQPWKLTWGGRLGLRVATRDELRQRVLLLDVGDILTRATAEHLEAASPHAVLALVAELRRVEAERDALLARAAPGGAATG